MFTVLSVRVVVRWIRKRCDEKSSVVEVMVVLVPLVTKSVQ